MEYTAEKFDEDMLEISKWFLAEIVKLRNEMERKGIEIAEKGTAANIPSHLLKASMVKATNIINEGVAKL